jgi:hypothetical protein
VLLALCFLARRYGTDRGLSNIEWLVHALNCPRPNSKLKWVLEKRGFTVQDVPGTGRVYRLIEHIL